MAGVRPMTSSHRRFAVTLALLFLAEAVALTGGSLNELFAWKRDHFDRVTHFS